MSDIYIMMNRLAAIVFGLFLSQGLFSQNQAANWLFGDFGLEFKKNSVIIRHDYAAHEYRAEGIISDKSGRLLFYTDGFTVWNRNHQQMPNGDNLMIKHTSHSIQGSLVVPKPGSESLYYIFSIDPWNGQESSGLYYSVVDMSLDNGMGDITEKGKRILSNVSDKMTAVYHSNNKDVWVVVKLVNSNSYYSFLITPAGVSVVPVISTVGKVETLSFDGQLKASPDGEKMACSFYNYNGEGIDLFDFDNSTGLLSNPVSFKSAVTYIGYNGLEFSPDGTKLYYTSSQGGIDQFDITGKTYDEINATQVHILSEIHNTLTQMQLAPDGKIYITKGGGGGGTDYLGVINYPNEYGTKCGAVENALFLEGGSSFVALTPMFIQNFFFKTSFGYKRNCQAASVGFYVSNKELIDSVKWSFGEGSISRSFNPEFKYAQAGTFKVQLIAFYPDRTDTVVKQVTINPFTPFDLGNDTTVCAGHKITIDEKFGSYRWNTGDTTSYINIEKDGWYKLTARNSFGCYSSDSVLIKIADLPVIVMPDTVFMNGEDSVQLSAGTFKTCLWSTGETTSSIYVRKGGWYSAAVTNNAGCLAARSVFVVENNIPANDTDNGWILLNPRPSRFKALDMCFISDNTGFIVNTSELIKTSDKGKTWNKVMNLSYGRRIAFKSNTGYIVGDNGTIYKSTFNGDGWNKLNVDFTDNLNAISLISKDTVIITSDKRLFVSNDGGKTWTKHDITGYVIKDSFFTTSQTGSIACAQGKILKTKDGGNTWRLTYNTNVFPSDFFRICFINEKTGFATQEYDNIFRTTDGGETWTSKSIVDAIYSINFVSDKVGYISGEYGVIDKTTDGGLTWNYCAPAGRIDGNDLNAIYFINEEEGFATGNGGRILKTVDGGKSWTQYSNEYRNVNQITFTDNNTGYFLSKKIYKTTDAGNTWTPLNTGVVDYDYHYFSYKMGHFFDSDNFIIVADDGYISVVLKTEDGGATFKKLNIYLHFEEASSLFFLNKSTGYVSCYDGAYSNGLYKTSDGGQNWSLISSLSFTQTYFRNELNGFGLRYGNLYSTSDGGATWTMINDTYGDLNQMQFVNDTTAYIAGEFNMVLKTTDGGKNWIECRTPYDHLLSVCFFNNNVGFVAGENGFIYKTHDGGYTWGKEYLSASINSMSFTENRNIYVAGGGGVILKNKISFNKFSFSINPVSSITCTEAKLTGTVTSNSSQIDNIRFEYGTGNTFSKSINATPTAIGAFTSDSVIARISGLEPEKEYNCRLAVTYDGTEYISDTLSFTTLPEYRITMSAPYIRGTDVALSALVTANKETIDNIVFEYGVTRNYINAVKSSPDKVDKGASYYVTARLTGLLQDVVYYYRLKAYMGSEIIYSEENMLKLEPDVLIIPAEVRQVSESNIILQGMINSGPVYLYHIQFEYGTTEDLGDEADASPSNISWGKSCTIETSLNNLIPRKKYFFRISATDGNKMYYSDAFSYTLGDPGDITDPTSIALFPNPAGDYFIIRDTEPVTKAEIFDSGGRLLFIKTNEELIDISSCPPGMYLVKIYTANKTFTKKIYKK